jgi:REP element-mobilizing transposase RayT
MTTYLEKLESGHFYHLYNRGINGCNLFQDENNYIYFLSLYEKYIDPIAETYAWVLMPNHFHFLIYIKDVKDLTGFALNLSGLEKPPHQYFSNLFNAYTKAYNKYTHRHGALFERPFKRKLIDSEEYLRQVVLYIHNNPKHHGFVADVVEYPWSSYLTSTSQKDTKLQREEVLNWFGDKKNFVLCHRNFITNDEKDYLE